MPIPNFVTGHRHGKIVILIILIFSIGILAGVQIQKGIYLSKKSRHSDYTLLNKYKFGWYHQYKTTIWEQFDKKGRILFIGASLTENGMWQELFPAVRVVNQGIGGDTTEALLARLHLAQKSDAEIAVLTIGTNDLIKNIDDNSIFANWIAIVYQLNRYKFKVIAVSVPMTTIKNTNEKIQKFNSKLTEACNNIPCEYLDINSKLSSNGVLRQNFTVDGIHLNIDGYREWAKLLIPHVD